MYFNTANLNLPTAPHCLPPFAQFPNPVYDPPNRLASPCPCDNKRNQSQMTSAHRLSALIVVWTLVAMVAILVTLLITRAPMSASRPINCL